MERRGKISMIDAGKFYTHDDLPERSAKFRMWANIKKEIQQSKYSASYVVDKRSFVWGVAASVIIYFTSVGVYTTVRQSMQNSRPQVVKFDAAYQSAINEFERVVPQTVSNSAADPNTKNFITIRKEQLSKIDEAIAGLRSESAGADLSSLKQKKLRELYGMKLKVLQEMIENGEIEL
jgi:hypothetical protein